MCREGDTPAASLSPSSASRRLGHPRLARLVRRLRVRQPARPDRGTRRCDHLVLLPPRLRARELAGADETDEGPADGDPHGDRPRCRWNVEREPNAVTGGTFVRIDDEMWHIGTSDRSGRAWTCGGQRGDRGHAKESRAVCGTRSGRPTTCRRARARRSRSSEPRCSRSSSLDLLSGVG
jgi:hypothetical protein